MTPSPEHRPMTPARRASILLLIFGGVAALFGLAMIAAAPSLNTAVPPPHLQERFDEIKRQLPFDLSVLGIVLGVVMLIYATIAVTLGVLVRNAGRVTVIVTLVLAAIVTAITAIQSGAGLIMGVGADALFSFGLAFGHGMVVKWMVQTLQRSTPAPMPLPLAPRKPPLADYYLPPSPPVAS